MEKIHIYLDETYNLQAGNQFYSINGFLTKDPKKMKTDYKKILGRCRALGREIKSTDREAEKLRRRLLNSDLWKELECISAYQTLEHLPHTFYDKQMSVNDKEVKLYKLLFNKILKTIIEHYDWIPKIVLHVEADRNGKIEISFFEDLEKKYKELGKEVKIYIKNSFDSLGIQLADQVNGIVRLGFHNDHEESFEEIIGFHKVLENPIK